MFSILYSTYSEFLNAKNILEEAFGLDSNRPWCTEERVREGVPDAGKYIMPFEYGGTYNCEGLVEGTVVEFDWNWIAPTP